MDLNCKSIFNSNDKDIKDLFINKSFNVLNQKNGNRKLAIEYLKRHKQIEIVEDFIVYKGPLIKNPIQRLTRTGVVVLPLIKNTEYYREWFKETLLTFPEYKKDISLYVLGGFAGLGNPAAYHAPIFRDLRIKAWKRMKPFFQKYASLYENKKLKNEYRFETFFSRPMYRQKGQAPVAEAWHRDVSKKSLIFNDNDEIYGGWINLDDKPQYLSCILGSHLNVKILELDSGFAELKKVFKKRGHDADNVKKLLKKVSSFKTKVVIPPGHIVMFPQYILHEVVATKAKYDMYRLFNGWRMTLSDKSIFNSEKIMSEQSITRLGGGMFPPMYSRNHSSLFLGIPTFKEQKDNRWIPKMVNILSILYPSDKMIEYKNSYKSAKNKRIVIADMIEEYRTLPYLDFKFDKMEFIFSTLQANIGTFNLTPGDKSTMTTLIKWSNETMKEELLVEKSNKRGYKYKIVDRYLKSLKHYGLPMYEGYDEDEAKIYKPYKLS